MRTADWVFLYFLLLTLFAALVVYLSRSRERTVQRNVRGSRILSSEQFEKNWIISEKSQKGYKYEVFSGCYVIFVFEHPVTNGNYRRFDDIYIGQSVNVTRRVHGHFTGKGNGDVYADIKYGRSVYVELVPCDREDMNETEKALIEVFHATESYNATQGGGMDRTSKRFHWPWHKK